MLALPSPESRYCEIQLPRVDFLHTKRRMPSLALIEIQTSLLSRPEVREILFFLPQKKYRTKNSYTKQKDYAQTFILKDSHPYPLWLSHTTLNRHYLSLRRAVQTLIFTCLFSLNAFPQLPRERIWTESRVCLSTPGYFIWYTAVLHYNMATELQIVHFGSCLWSPGKSPFVAVCSDTIMIQVPGLIRTNSWWIHVRPLLFIMQL